MKNPLIKRLPRELFGEIGKYIVIFVLMVFTVGFVSGFLVADNSMIAAYNEGFEKYNIEDGNFETIFKPEDSRLEEIEDLGITLYENFYVEEEASNDTTLRIFANREEVNKVCVMEGSLAEKSGEIAIDRMYAENNGIEVGDTIKIAGEKYKVTGLVALSDYSCLFEDNSDTMFDSVKFGVAVTTKDNLDSFGDKHLHYSYSFIYDEKPADDTEEKEVSDELMKDINSIAPLETFIPLYANQAIQFTGEDMGSDRSMMVMLLYIVIVIMAFVFGVTISNTIAKEANVIGTLRASGYTKAELVRHYMAVPILVTFISAVVGNILGYTVLKDVCAGMYYGSYSLPTYVTRWNAEAFLLTTVVPIVIMLVITLLVLINKLSLSPLNFLRRDLKRRQRKKAFKLSTKIKIFTRFRLRVFFQNKSSYVVMFFGILFVNILLMFGLALPEVLNAYQDDITSNMICDYQYILKTPAETETKGAEKITLASLITTENEYKDEEITFYGISSGSDYIDIDTSKDGVYISDGFADKFSIEEGDTISFTEEYGDGEYSFKVAGTYDYPGSLSVFMPIDDLNEALDYEDGYFNGYFSNEEIDDIDEAYIASVIDEEALTKVSRQLDRSMGNMMYLVDGFSVLIFAVVIYLLSKIVIEKNAQSISMTKILGYTNGEISRLYVMTTTIVTILCMIITIPIDYVLLKWMFKTIMMSMITGWFPLDIPVSVFVEMVVMGIVAYAIVAVFEMRRIKRVPMGEALKNAE